MSRGEAIVRQLKLLLRLEHAPQGICFVAEFEHGSAGYKQLRRDVDALEEANIPLLRERRDGREWVYLEEGYRRHKLPPLSDLEVLALRWVTRSAELPVPDLDTALRELLDKLDAPLAEGTRAFAKTLDETFVSDRFGRPSAANLEHVRCCSDACGERRSLDLVYRAASGKISERRVDPYNVWSHRGGAYLVAWCQLRGAIRTFSIARFQSVTATDETFELRDGYTFDDFVQQRFRIMDDGETHTVRIWFACEAALYIQERVWHPTQRFEDADGGAVVLEMTVDGLVELASWVMSFGPRARVLGPPRLVELVRGQLEAALSAYGGDVAGQTGEEAKGKKRGRTRK